MEEKKDAERSRSTGALSAAVEEGKFHVSVRVSQRAQIFLEALLMCLLLRHNNISHHVASLWVKEKLQLQVRMTCWSH